MLNGPWKSLEDLVAKTNAGFFLKEFSFARTRFRSSIGNEVELADHVVAFDDVLIVCQLKQRERRTADLDAEVRWYRNKVRKKAVKQVRDTVRYLSAEAITLVNDRGHSIALPQGSTNHRMLKLVVYLPGMNLPTEVRHEKAHLGSAGDFIHVLHAEDYVGVLRTFVTLPEIVQYLEFREALCRAFPSDVALVPEQAVVGQFLAGGDLRPPQLIDVEYLTKLKGDADRYQIFAILHQFNEKTYGTEGDGRTNYYAVLSELLRLPRTDLGVFKERFEWAWEKCDTEITQPSRFLSVTTGCAFVFIPVPQELESIFRQGLENFTEAAKYDLKADRCLGISFRRDGEFRLLDWMRLEYPWQHNEEMERRLRDSPPFRPSRMVGVHRYEFRP